MRDRIDTQDNEIGKKISQIITPMKEGASTSKTKILEAINFQLEKGCHSIVESLAKKGQLECLTKAELKAVFYSYEFIEIIIDNAVSLKDIDKLDFFFFKSSFFDYLINFCLKILTHKLLSQLKEKVVENELVPRIIFSYYEVHSKRRYYEYFDVCRRFVKDNPSSPEVWNALGNYLSKIGASTQALIAFDFATRLEKQSQTEF